MKQTTVAPTTAYWFNSTIACSIRRSPRQVLAGPAVQILPSDSDIMSDRQIVRAEGLRMDGWMDWCVHYGTHWKSLNLEPTGATNLPPSHVTPLCISQIATLMAEIYGIMEMGLSTAVSCVSSCVGDFIRSTCRIYVASFSFIYLKKPKIK